MEVDFISGVVADEGESFDGESSFVIVGIIEIGDGVILGTVVFDQSVVLGGIVFGTIYNFQIGSKFVFSWVSNVRLKSYPGVAQHSLTWRTKLSAVSTKLTLTLTISGTCGL